ncbi:ankyrin repeat-containing domain protein [Mycena capillaripes]|nr:ankyrin repeat-containing domain protein [Mycena capillaripes]
MAVDAGNIEAAGLLLEAGANTKAKFGLEQHQPLHLTVRNPNLEMMKLLLDHGAPIDATFGHDASGTRWTALHLVCANGHLEVIKLLLERGASLECQGHFGSALGFAVHRRQLDAVKILLNKGADATVIVPLFTKDIHWMPPPCSADLLYIAMGLRHPPHRQLVQRRFQNGLELATWDGLPLDNTKKELMAMLLAHGASKDTTMRTITEHLDALALEAQYTKEDYLEVIAGMLKEVEDAVPDIVGGMKDAVPHSGVPR